MGRRSLMLATAHNRMIRAQDPSRPAFLHTGRYLPVRKSRTRGLAAPNGSAITGPPGGLFLPVTVAAFASSPVALGGPNLLRIVCSS